MSVFAKINMYQLDIHLLNFCVMTLEEFESQTREELEQTLNQLQAATLLIAELTNQISQTGTSVQVLGQSIETFVTQQRSQ